MKNLHSYCKLQKKYEKFATSKNYEQKYWITLHIKKKINKNTFTVKYFHHIITVINHQNLARLIYQKMHNCNDL